MMLDSSTPCIPERTMHLMEPIRNESGLLIGYRCFYCGVTTGRKS